MSSKDEQTVNTELEERVFSQQQEKRQVARYQKRLEEAQEEPQNLMESVYSSSLKLLEQEVIGGNTEVALAYLKTYHFCQAIDFQILAPILSKTNLSELESICSLPKIPDPNKGEYLQSLEALIEAQEIGNEASELTE